MSVLVKFVLSPDLLESSKAVSFQQEIETVIKNGSKILMLDLKNVSSLTNSGLMALVSILKIVRASNGILLLTSLSEQVRMLLEITGLEQIFSYFTEEE